MTGPAQHSASDARPGRPAEIPFVAAGLSAILPGIGQLYNGEHAKAAAILCSSLGIWAGLLWTTIGPEAFRSWLTTVALLLAYPFLLLPAVLDAHRRARGARIIGALRSTS